MNRPSSSKLRRLACIAPFALALAIAPAPSSAKSRSKRLAKQRGVALQEKVMAEVKRSLPGGLHVAEVSMPDTLHRHARKGDVVALKWRSSPSKGRSVVQVVIHKKSGRVKKGWARVELVRLEGVIVASVDLPAGSIVRAGQLRVEERPMLDGHELQFEPSYIVGARVLSAIDAGQTLLSDDVSMPVPIARGTPVRVVVRRAGLVVSRGGVLESKSQVGALARVRVGGKVLNGKLVQADRVELGGLQ